MTCDPLRSGGYLCKGCEVFRVAYIPFAQAGMQVKDVGCVGGGAVGAKSVQSSELRVSSAARSLERIDCIRA